ncbi:MAG: ATP-binding protein [Thermotogaceae bacterium]|nr:ATP-binding protein [Thermotogaceae bacterium]
MLKFFPAVAILGPRQVGKTTLVKKLRGKLTRESVYIDLENPVDYGALSHPIEFFNSVADKVIIIDEVQRKPDIFPVLRSVIDSNRWNGRFILLGSASPDLLFLSNETLAGRIVYLELTGLMFSEVRELSSFREHWMSGGFPDAFKQHQQSIRHEWLKSFISTYVERDLRILGLNTSSLDLMRLLQMLAAQQGGLMNASSLANSLGVSSPTISKAISFFEKSFIIRRLTPWSRNIGKRLVKSPKVYVRDSGVVNYLLGLSTYEEILKHPLLGHLWEGYVVEEIINSMGDDYNFYFYRTQDGAECDLVIFRAGECIAAIDAKFSPQPKTTKSMAITLQDLKPRRAYYVVPQNHTIYSISENQYVATPWQILRALKS